MKSRPGGQVMERHERIRGKEWPAGQLFYIQDARQVIGNCVAWWRPNGSGYCVDLKEAWKVPYVEAVKIEDSRTSEILWPCEEIDAVTQVHVDIQKLRPLQKKPAHVGDQPPYPNLADGV